MAELMHILILQWNLYRGFQLSLNELLVLANMESYNAVLIEKGLEQKERMIELRKLARNQMLSLEKLGQKNITLLEDKK